MSDFGMKISRQGYDVNTCSDNQLLWSSSFSMPLVIQSGNYGISSFGSTQTIVTHNLGYVPVAFPLTNGYNASSGSSGSCDFDVNGIAGSGSILIDDTKIWYRAGSFSSTKTITYYIFGLDLETDLTGTSIDLTDDTLGTINTDWGFKVSKDGKSTDSNTLSDLASFSGNSSLGYPVRHQMIHAIGGVVNLTSGSTSTIAHGLGYKPMFLWYADKGADGYCIISIDYSVVAGPAVEIKARTWADSTNIYFYNNSGGTHSLRYVIFKDPLL